MKRLPEREEDVRAGSRARTLTRSVVWYDSVESTMDLARTAAEEGAPEGSLVVADEQTRGRGRKGDSWFSPAGSGLWTSLVLRPTVPVARAPEITVLAARSVKEMLELDFGVAASVKPPNDVLVTELKICGVIAESASQAGRDHVDWLVLGLGFDVSVEFPPELAPLATSLHRHMKSPPSIPQLLCRFLERFEGLYLSFQRSGC